MQNYFAEKSKSGVLLLDAIRTACVGLIYISERDAPVVPFAGPKGLVTTGKITLEQIGPATNEPVEEVSFEAFFDRLTTNREWFGKAEKARAERFRVLRKLLEDNLYGLQVLKLGSIKIEILVVGLDKDGCVMGVRTMAVET